MHLPFPPSGLLSTPPLHTHRSPSFSPPPSQPENVLLTEQWGVKLADFGLSIDLNEERANTRAGTLGKGGRGNMWVGVGGQHACRHPR